jgi:hypothetical protein
VSSALTLVQLAFAGTAALIVVAYAMKFDRTRSLTDEADVIAALRQSNPDIDVQTIVIAFDRRAALVRDHGKRLFGLFVMGDDVAVRTLSDSDVEPLGPERVMIVSSDLGLPKREFSAPAPSLMRLDLRTLAKEGHHA